MWIQHSKNTAYWFAAYGLTEEGPKATLVKGIDMEEIPGANFEKKIGIRKKGEL
jgi:hypothetical protein